MQGCVLFLVAVFAVVAFVVAMQSSNRASKALAELAELRRRLVGLEMLDRAIPRPHYPVLAHGREVGHVTSGTFSPTLGKGIALAYVPPELGAIGTELAIQVRGEPHPAHVVKTPFYKPSAVSHRPSASG